MQDNLFDTPQKVEAAVGAFKMLLDSPGWQLIEKIIDANIQVVTEQILTGVEDETKETIDLLRYRLQVLKEVRQTPHTMIAKFESQESSEIEVDPFHTVESLQAEREAQEEKV